MSDCASPFPLFMGLSAPLRALTCGCNAPLKPGSCAEQWKRALWVRARFVPSIHKVHALVRPEQICQVAFMVANPRALHRVAQLYDMT